ncbi:MAG: hypothetical protein JWO19_3792 [Bryobacterales bacterium]|nr:hypothetical protein [Bryobacterales bacterium]
MWVALGEMVVKVELVLWRTHSCVPHRHSCRCPAFRAATVMERAHRRNRPTILNDSRLSPSRLWRTHSCVPHRHSCRCPAFRAATVMARAHRRNRPTIQNDRSLSPSRPTVTPPAQERCCGLLSAYSPNIAPSTSSVADACASVSFPSRLTSLLRSTVRIWSSTICPLLP